MKRQRGSTIMLEDSDDGVIGDLSGHDEDSSRKRAGSDLNPVQPQKKRTTYKPKDIDNLYKEV